MRKKKKKINYELLEDLKILEQDHSDYSHEEAQSFLIFCSVVREARGTIQAIPKKYKN